MKIKILVVFCFFSVNLFSQIPAEAISSFESYLSGLVDDEKALGLSVAIRVGDDLWKGAYGKNTATLDLTTDDQMGIGSTTKTVVSAIILDMMENGEITLSDPISSYLPDFTNIDNSVTIRQLLNHTSGIHNYTDHPSFFTVMLTNQTKVYQPSEVLAQFVNAASFPKGTKQEYSNTNYLLLGMIIKEITQNEFQDEFHTRFNQNNDYPDMQLAPQEVGLEDVGHLWLDVTFTGAGPLVDFIAAGNSLNSVFSSAHSAGAMVSTPEDIANWTYDLYTGNLLEASSMDSLFTYDPLLLSGQVKYGLGVFELPTTCQEISLGHGGNIIYTSAMFYVPALDLAISVLTNDGSGITSEQGVSGIADELVCSYKSIFSAIDNSDLLDQISIFPNPAADEFIIDLEGVDFKKGRVNIFNSIGQKVFQGDFLNKKQLVVNTLEDTGMYIVSLNLDGRVMNEILLKQ